jgi:Flp pilus assembly protein TadG
VGLLAVVALALDMGILMIARNQCQAAADAAAMAGARTLTGDTTTNNNYSNVQPNATSAVSGNTIFGQAINPASQLTLTIGDYYYDTTSASFKINPNGRQTGDNWTLVQATVTSQQPSFFSKVLGIGSLNATAMATAAHRPRDAVIVVDFSGSMRFDSLLGSPHSGARTASMNPDTVYPTWGHYNGNSSLLTYSADVQIASGEVIGNANTAVPTTDAPTAVITGFYADTTAFGTTTPAFTSASSSYATTPGGDAPLQVTKNTGPGYAHTVNEFLGSSSRDWRFELDGYSAYAAGSPNANVSSATDYTNAPFNGYTQGPGYWGKTFFTWPPDPRVPLTTTYYTSAQIQNIVQQFLVDFGYTSSGSAQDFNNTSVLTTLSAAVLTTTATSITVSSSTSFPSAPFQIMVGTVSSGAFQTSSSLEIMNVTAVSGTTWTVQRGQSGTTVATFAVGKSVGLLTAPPLYGIFNAASTSLAPAGKTPAGSSLWTSWTSAAALGNYLTTNVYKPGNKNKLATSDAIYQQLLRLYNRNGGPGMPVNGSGTAMPCDWRARFFTTPSGAPLLDDSKLWSAGSLQAPSSSTYLINYNAILDWIKNCGTNPFPNQLRAGGVVYYTAIPTTIDTSTFPPADPNQRIWKEYIDEVLGLQQTGGSGSNPTYNTNPASRFGYGGDFSWGTVSTSGQPSGWPTSTYISYTDNPQRPLLRMWFGPLTLIDFLGNYNASDPSNNNSPRLWWPGTVTETPTYQTKLAIQAALKNTLQNHPNDNVGLIFFSSPRSSASATGYYNYARVPLCRDERLLINSLWFSPKVITTNAEISVYNSSGSNPGDIYDVPRANGGTCYAMPLMIAYNQFSSNSSLVNYTANSASGTAGGLGRNGANKLLVFETDGMVNTGASANLVSSSNGTGYYQVRVADAHNYSASGTEFPTGVTGVTFSAGATQSQTIAQQICNNLSSGGFSTTRKPVKIHCIAFGSLFEPTNTSSAKTNALQNLASLEVIGSVQSAGATTLASNKIVIGNFNTRIANLQAAFTSIMQDGVQVTLLSSGPGLP